MTRAELLHQMPPTTRVVAKNSNLYAGGPSPSRIVAVEGVDDYFRAAFADSCRRRDYYRTTIGRLREREPYLFAEAI